MTNDDFYFTAWTTMAVVAGVIVGVFFYSAANNSTMETRCEAVCGSLWHENYDADSHACTCQNGGIYHIRTVVETLKAPRENRR